jgi:AcrR family transcriptional regulator
MKKQDSTNPLRKSERTKRFIIETTAPIFNSKGYAGTSLSDLTAATKLTKGSIYGNFKNKDEVAVEAFKYNLSVIFGELQTRVSRATTPLHKLLAVTTSYRRVYKTINDMGGSPISHTMVDAGATHPQLRALVHYAVKRIMGLIEGLVQEGVKSGQLKKTDAKKVAGLVVSLIEGGLLIAPLNKDKKYFENALQQVEKIILDLKK